MSSQGPTMFCLVLSLFWGLALGYTPTLLNCTESQDKFEHLPSLCQTNVTQRYSSSDYPIPHPCNITSRIRIKQLLEVDEDDETFTLYVDFSLFWNDTRLSMKTDGNEDTDWFPLLEKRLEHVWTPTIVFTNAISVKKLDTYGDDLTRRFFFYKNETLNSRYFYYQVYLIIKMTCNLNFTTFPFDYQKCELHYTNIVGTTKFVELLKPIILDNEESDQKCDGRKSVRIESGILPFDARLKAVSVADRYDYGGNYSRAGVKVELVRDITALNQLLGSYFVPTGIFSLLSMFSFFIKAEQVRLKTTIFNYRV